MATLQALQGPAVLAGLAFACFMALHLLVWRSPLRRGLAYGWIFTLLAVGCVAAPTLWETLLWRTLGDRLGPWTHHAVPAATLYLLLAMLYVHVYSGLVRSLSVRILGELATVATRRLEADELACRYPLGEILDRRLDALEATSWIERRGEGFDNLDRGRRWAGWLKRLARLYRQDVTG